MHSALLKCSENAVFKRLRQDALVRRCDPALEGLNWVVLRSLKTLDVEEENPLDTGPARPMTAYQV